MEPKKTQLIDPGFKIQVTQGVQNIQTRVRTPCTGPGVTELQLGALGKKSNLKSFSKNATPNAKSQRRFQIVGAFGVVTKSSCSHISFGERWKGL